MWDRNISVGIVNCKRWFSIFNLDTFEFEDQLKLFLQENDLHMTTWHMEGLLMIKFSKIRFSLKLKNPQHF